MGSNSWREVKLSDLGEVARGRSRHRPRYAEHLYGGEYPFIQTGDIKASEGRISSHEQTYSEAGLAQSRLWPAGTMCITIAANIAETGVLQYPACFPDSVIGFIADKNKADVYYIEYVFRKLRKDIQRQATGSVQDNINLQTFERLKFKVPHVEEQHRIANFLNHFDKKITLNRQINQTLEQMAQTLFKSWFVDFDPVVDNALDAGFFEQDLGFSEELLHRVEVRKTVRKSNNFKPLSENIRRLFPNAFEECVESALGLGGWVPKGWNNGCISDVAHYRTKRINTSELTLTNYISTENMLVDRKGIQKATALPTVNSVPAYTSGTILISNIRPYFKKIWLAKGDGGYSNDVLGFEVKDQGTEEYLFNLMYQDSFFDFMMATSKGSKMPRGDKKAILGLELVVPPLKLRKLFSKNVNGFYTSSSIRNNENHALGHLRDTLLPKLISGELSLSNIKIDIPEETLI
ncbi:TPA: restriction endonuclease subunit S [Proteus mirabilis]|uniref:restriction endonuclease subunit S n=1 Tax=Proteus mirabilis TaxID=584 RepID=UPI001582B41D|nr:restriction endonuclease subunit S [Proteus mirabilis]MBI6368932.1 restriction endonuclease subunit S [Proteus mirabilis]MBO8263870.1 restriction endonuclease subunit S [Proteus mirabilis]MBO8264779.1 restriction endonuclease subunit S [Proteus mirabilis]MBO8268960.1 restriction endonuclease subunit S [Proteus mirabilis]MBO8274284.1 restriction endonuclease subunit S [Proteus mirabilis]